MSEVVEITVQFVNFPKEGKRNGSIKSSEGDFYWGTEPMLRQFSKGEVCKIEYDAKPRDGGGEWRTLKKKIAGAAVKPMAQMRQRTNPADSEQMFVVALLKSYIEAGKLDLVASDIIQGGNACRSAYRTMFGDAQKQTIESEFDDSIPH